MTKQRFIIVTADSIYRVLAQYLQGSVPEKVVVTGLQYNPNEKGAIRINFTSEEKPEKPLIEVKFDVRQTFGG